MLNVALVWHTYLLEIKHFPSILFRRFYQIHSNGTKGDTADNFAFHTFFPNVIQPPIALVCNTIFSVFVKFKICKRPVRKYDISGPSSSASISISLPGTELSHDTERRRQIALKALSERLNKAESQNKLGAEAGWPNLEEDSPPKSKEQDQQQQQQQPANTAASVHIPMDGQGGGGGSGRTGQQEQQADNVWK